MRDGSIRGGLVAARTGRQVDQEGYRLQPAPDPLFGNPDGHPAAFLIKGRELLAKPIEVFVRI
jgi:hypothetical protein